MLSGALKATRRARSLVIVGLGLVLSALGGCRGEGAPCAVTGEVRFDGEPVATGDLRLDPIGGTPGPGGSAKIQDGRFAIPLDKGLLAGKYLVRITATRATGRKVKARESLDGNRREVDEIVQYIPARYNFASDLTVELAPGDNQKSLKLQSK